MAGPSKVVEANQAKIPEPQHDLRAAQFEQQRTRLFGLAYRMIGVRADAEDIVQETYLRWHDADHQAIRSPEAWLVTVATRLAIDRLRVLEAGRISYVGEWLPEPIVDSRPDRNADIHDDISLAFLYVLQRLGPEERAAFLLHEVLDTDYTTIAGILGKSEATVRQMVHRARERVHTESPRFQVNEDHHRALVQRFVEAVQTADETALMNLFAENATWTSDGGGKATAAVNILRGREVLVKFLKGIRNKITTGLEIHPATVNGTPGLLFRVAGTERPFSVYSFETDGERITGVYAVLNPDKLQNIDQP